MEKGNASQSYDQITRSSIVLFRIKIFSRISADSSTPTSQRNSIEQLVHTLRR